MCCKNFKTLVSCKKLVLNNLERNFIVGGILSFSLKAGFWSLQPFSFSYPCHFSYFLPDISQTEMKKNAAGPFIPIMCHFITALAMFLNHFKNISLRQLSIFYSKFTARKSGDLNKICSICVLFKEKNFLQAFTFITVAIPLF